MSKERLYLLLKKYDLSNQEIAEIIHIINPIFLHDDFQRRCTKAFLHHDEITLGEHILEVAVFTYILIKKYNKNMKANVNYALKIALLHDLYTEPWQNNPESKVDSIFHKHALRHPIEAVINSCVWFPEIFDNSTDARIITDGIVHHMFPLPVASLSKTTQNQLELRNFEYIKEMNPQVLNNLVKSSNKAKIGDLSMTPSAYIEGKIVSSADKIVTIKNFKGKNINGLSALITGNNKNLVRVRELKNNQNN